jgi:hypothetical protein
MNTWSRCTRSYRCTSRQSASVYVSVSASDTFHFQVIWGRVEKGVWGFHSCGPEDSSLLRIYDFSLDAYSPTVQNIVVPLPSGSNNTKRTTAQPPKRRNYDSPKRRKFLIQIHTVTSQKNWMIGEEVWNNLGVLRLTLLFFFFYSSRCWLKQDFHEREWWMKG